MKCACGYEHGIVDGTCSTCDTRTRFIEYVRDRGTWPERMWLPILRLAHWWARRPRWLR